MRVYTVDHQERETATRRIVKENIRSSKGVVKLAVILAWILRTLSIILGLGTIAYVVFFSKKPLDLIFLIITAGFPFGLSFIPAAFYYSVAGREYRLRGNESVSLSEDGFVYSFRDRRILMENTVYAFRVLYHQVKSFEYDSYKKLLMLNANIIVDTYVDGEKTATDEMSELSFLDVYEIQLNQLLSINCSLGGETDANPN